MPSSLLGGLAGGCFGGLFGGARSQLDEAACCDAAVCVDRPSKKAPSRQQDAPVRDAPVSAPSMVPATIGSAANNTHPLKEDRFDAGLSEIGGIAPGLLIPIATPDAAGCPSGDKSLGMVRPASATTLAASASGPDRYKALPRSHSSTQVNSGKSRKSRAASLPPHAYMLLRQHKATTPDHSGHSSRRAAPAVSQQPRQGNQYVVRQTGMMSLDSSVHGPRRELSAEQPARHWENYTAALMASAASGSVHAPTASRRRAPSSMRSGGGSNPNLQAALYRASQSAPMMSRRASAPQNIPPQNIPTDPIDRLESIIAGALLHTYRQAVMDRDPEKIALYEKWCSLYNTNSSPQQ